MYYSDTHIHSTFSDDAESTMEEMVQQGIKLGLKEIYITDHMDFYQEKELQSKMMDNVNYISKYNELANKYKDQIKVKLGIEMGLQPYKDLIIRTKDIINKYPFDFVIGSTHLVEKIDIGLDKTNKFFEGRTQEEAYRRYYEDILESVNCYDEFDVYGHIDYVVRYGGYKNPVYKFEDYKEIIDEILKIIISKGKGIEINTSGIRRGLGHPHPKKDIVERYKELGGEIIVLGSDAHNTKDICYGFDAMYELLEDVGFKYIASYEKRKVEFVSIDKIFNR